MTESFNGGRRSGFSLLELLLVMTIILILTTLMLSGGPSHRRRQQLAGCRNNLLSIYQALETFALDSGGVYPATNAARSEAPLSLLVPRDTTRTEIFLCPAVSLRKLTPAEPFVDRKIAYSYAMGLRHGAGAGQWLAADEQINTRPKSVGQPLFSTDGGRGSNHSGDGGNLVFCDGHTDHSGVASDFPIAVPAGGAILNP